MGQTPSPTSTPRPAVRDEPLVAMAGLAEQDLPARALYIVALPIGNAADITLRALWVLAHVDAIASEDTRVTAPLLTRYGIRTPLLAAHQHNERAVAETIVARLAAGERIAVVTDAGTPGVSDPGAVLARAVLDAGLRVVPVPGASSALAALSAAGMTAARFRFVGFLPSGASERDTLLRGVAASADATVLFEAPHRIRALLAMLADALPPQRRVVLARELTKKFETVGVHAAADLRGLDAEERGEYVVLIDGDAGETPSALDDDARRWLDALLQELTPARAAAVVARVTGVPRSIVYDAALAAKKPGALPQDE